MKNEIKDKSVKFSLQPNHKTTSSTFMMGGEKRFVAWSMMGPSYK